MSSWDALLRLTSAAFANVFGEDVTYTPYGGTPRTIKAVVDRLPPQADAGGNGMVVAYQISARNDSTYGIDADAVNYRGDTITLARNPGGAATLTLRIVQRYEEGDAGMVRFLLT